MSSDARSIEWMPLLGPSSELPLNNSEVRITPVFLLSERFGAPPYIPATTHTLNVIEPRYVAMYNEILMKGSRSFAIFARDPEDKDQFAAVGVTLYLTDLKEVSRQLRTAAKYKCMHNVSGRVRLHGILNPGDATSRTDYLKAKVSDLVDVDNNVDTRALEAAAVLSLRKVAEAQEASDEQVRFNKPLVAQMHAGRGVCEGSLWAMAASWADLVSLLAVQTVGKLQIEVHGAIVEDPRRLLNAWSAGPLSVDVHPGASEAVKAEVRLMWRRLNDEIAPLLSERFQGVQLMLQTDRHAERLQIFTELMEHEARRLRARATLETTLRCGKSDC